MINMIKSQNFYLYIFIWGNEIYKLFPHNILVKIVWIVWIESYHDENEETCNKYLNNKMYRASAVIITVNYTKRFYCFI